MSLQTWSETLIAAQSDGTALNTSTTATSILPGAAKFTLPSNFFSIGKVLRVTAGGRISNIVTTPGTLAFSLRLGATAVWAPAAFSLNTAAKTNVGWRLEALLTCRSIGNGVLATLLGQGHFASESVVGAAVGTTNSVQLPASAPAVGTGFDSTAAQVVDLFAQWSISNAGNSIQVHQYTLESIN